MAVQIIRKAYFNAAHRLYNPNWSDSDNFEIFGKCSYPNYHGHNYILEVSLKGEVDPETGMLINLKHVEDLIQKYVIDKLDHKNLNLDVEEFKEIIPTAENIAIVIYNLLNPHLNNFGLQVKLHETKKNIAIYPV